MRKPGSEELDLGVALLFFLSIADKQIQVTSSGDQLRLMDSSWEHLKKVLANNRTMDTIERARVNILKLAFRKRN